MALDTVELVMAFEEEFGIEIPDADAEQMRSAGNVASYILEEMHRRGSTGVDVDAIIERLRAVTVKQLGVDPDIIFPWTRFVEDLGAD